MTLTLLARLLITARSTLTSINSFGFIWKSLASLCPAHPSLFSSPRVRVVPRSLRKARDPRPLTPGLPPAGRSWKNKQFPGSQSPRVSRPLLPRPGLLFWSDAQSSSLNSLQCSQHPGACVSKPSAEFQLRAHQLSPDYFLHMCQALF